MTGRQSQQNTDAALRSLLQSVQALEAFLRAEEPHRDAGHSIARTTRALIGLIEGWCIDHVMRTKHDVLDGLSRDGNRDEAVIAALRHQFQIEDSCAKSGAGADRQGGVVGDRHQAVEHAVDDDRRP
ncbi:MAG: hypothetical protein ACFB13_21620 [Kiloniellaceae bacterium]